MSEEAAVAVARAPRPPRVGTPKAEKPKSDKPKRRKVHKTKRRAKRAASGSLLERVEALVALAKLLKKL